MTATAGEPGAPRVVTPAFARVWLATLAGFMSFGVYLVALPLYVKDALDRGALGVGIAVGAGSLTAVLSGPPAGRLADRRGRRVVGVTGAAVMFACYLGLALEPSLPAVVALRLVAGIGEAAFVVGAFTVVTDLAPPERRGEAVSLVTLASYSALAVGPLAADFALGGDRYALPWLIAAGLAAAAALLVFSLPETRPDTGEEAPRGWLPPTPALLPGLLVLLGLLGFGGFNALGALYARELGFDHPGFVFLLFGAVVVLVRSVGRKLPDRLGAERAVSLACVALVAGLLVIGGVRTAEGLLVGTAVFATGQSLLYPSVILLAIRRTSPAERSAVVGSITAFVDVALGLGAFTLGAVAAAAGYGGSFLVAAAVAATALLVLVRLRGSPEPRPA